MGLDGPAGRRQLLEDVLFEGDPLLSDAERQRSRAAGRFRNIVPVDHATKPRALRHHLSVDRRIRLLNVAALVHLAQAGDRAAFATLYERFSGYVYAILLARMPHQDAADHVQDVFVHALEKLGSLREPAAFPGWIAAIARRRAIDAFRARPGESNGRRAA